MRGEPTRITVLPLLGRSLATRCLLWPAPRLPHPGGRRSDASRLASPSRQPSGCGGTSPVEALHLAHLKVLASAYALMMNTGAVLRPNQLYLSVFSGRMCASLIRCSCQAYQPAQVESP